MAPLSNPEKIGGGLGDAPGPPSASGGWNELEMSEPHALMTAAAKRTLVANAVVRADMAEPPVGRPARNDSFNR